MKLKSEVDYIKFFMRVEMTKNEQLPIELGKIRKLCLIKNLTYITTAVN